MPLPPLSSEPASRETIHKAIVVKEKVKDAYKHVNNSDEIQTQRFAKHSHDHYMEALKKIIDGKPITEQEKERLTTIEQHANNAITALNEVSRPM